MLIFIKRFMQEENGQGLTEYGLILAFIALAVVATLSMLGDEVAVLFGRVNNMLNDITTQ